MGETVWQRLAENKILVISIRNSEEGGDLTQGGREELEGDPILGKICQRVLQCTTESFRSRLRAV